MIESGIEEDLKTLDVKEAAATKRSRPKEARSAPALQKSTEAKKYANMMGFPLVGNCPPTTLSFKNHSEPTCHGDRKWYPSKLGSQFKDGSKKLEEGDFVFSVCSYNILADAHMMTHRNQLYRGM